MNIKIRTTVTDGQLVNLVYGSFMGLWEGGGGCGLLSYCIGLIGRVYYIQLT